MTGTELLSLQCPFEVITGNGLRYRFATMPVNDGNAGGIQCAGGIDHMAEHRLAGQRVQHLRQCRLHARALAGGENNDCECHASLVPLSDDYL